MLKLKKIAVTGGLSAGKTTVCRIFKELGAYVVSADAIVHQLLSSESAITHQVVNLIGSDIVNQKSLDRKKIAARVFSQPDLRIELEKIIHPAVFDEIEQRYQQISQEKKHPLFVAEIPLLYESEEEKRFDTVVSVSANSELCRSRFVEQTHNPAQEFDQRMKQQLSAIHKAEKADYTIENNGTLQQLKSDVQKLYLQLITD
jgi:dephospho-CoA kinase